MKFDNEIYKKAAIGISNKAKEYIKRPLDAPLRAKDLQRHPPVRKIVEDAGFRTIYQLLYKLDRLKLLDYIPQLRKELRGDKKTNWFFDYSPNKNLKPLSSLKESVDNILLEKSIFIKKDCVLFEAEEITSLENHYTAMVNLINSKIKAHSEVRKRFIQLHNSFIDKRADILAETYYEKLWIKYLAYRIYFQRQSNS